MKKLLYFLIAVIISGCNSPTEVETDKYQFAMDVSIEKLILSTSKISVGKFPKLTDNKNNWTFVSSKSWTSGFYPGCLWYGYKLSDNHQLKHSAEIFTEGLYEEQYTTEHHDVGFMIFNSYGLGYKITGNESYKNVILQAAKSLSSRYNENVGCIQSWNGDFQVIIDNMMNLELLFWASKNGGDATYYDMAVSHANKTLQNHIREDGSSYHVVIYDPGNGNVLYKKTVQGYADNSTWARGQAWGIYGFTMSYRETGNEEFLAAAVKMADYYIQNLSKDFIPYWDFNLPNNYEKDFRDASAATIALSGLIELNTYINNPNYSTIIKETFNSLITNYLNEFLEDDGIIEHCAYYVNHSDPTYWDAATIWGDYYFLEAINRYNNK